MSNLIYLFIAVGVSAVGVLILWLRHRPASSPHASVDEFSHKMRALAPEPGPDREVRGTEVPPSGAGDPDLGGDPVLDRDVPGPYPQGGVLHGERADRHGPPDRRGA